MKKGQRGKTFAISLTLAVFLVSAYVLPVQAGASSKVINESSYAEEISGAVWNNMDEDIEVKDSALVFPENSSKSTKLITKTVAEKNSYCKNLIEAEATIQLMSIPKEETFAVALGLDSVRANLGEPGNVEIRFTNKNGFQISVIEIAEDGKENVIMQPKTCPSTTRLKAVVATEGKIQLFVNGTEVCDSKLQGTGEGRFGFIQSGSCHITASDVKITTYTYSRPENCNISEDFEKESYNSNLFFSKVISISDGGYTPSYIATEKYEDSNVLMFRNVGTGFLSTKVKYSNFEMTFDVPYIQREDEMNQEGKVITPVSDCFAIVIGAEDYEQFDAGNAVEMVVFYSDQVMLYFQDESWSTEQFQFRKADETRDFSVKLSMIDSVLKVAMKWEGEDNWITLGTKNIEMSDGYVQIADPSLGALNFAVDNLEIKNLDQEPNLIDIEYERVFIGDVSDWEYEPLEYVYAEQAGNNKTDIFSWYIAIPFAVVLGAAMIVTAVFVRKGRKDTTMEIVSNDL